MKNYKKPEEFKVGVCFLCHEPCERYVHFACALAYYEDKEKRIKQASEDVRL